MRQPKTLRERVETEARRRRFLTREFRDLGGETRFGACCAISCVNIA